MEEQPWKLLIVGPDLNTTSLVECMSDFKMTQLEMSSGEKRHEIVVERLAEVLEDHQNELLELLENDNIPTVYWGTACTGIPHFGYLVPMLKIADFLRANCRVKILLADIHAYLDNMKTTLELCGHRAEFYKVIIRELLISVGVPIEKLCFVKGSDFQL